MAQPDAKQQQIGYVALVVRDYDETIESIARNSVLFWWRIRTLRRASGGC
jgi:hypothetical protein